MVDLILRLPLIMVMRMTAVRKRKQVQLRVLSNPAFREVHKSKHRYVVKKGSAGSGKSVDTAQQYILRLMNQKGRNLLCIRKSDVTHRDSTFAELTAAIERMGLSPSVFTYTTNPMAIKCKNGNKIIFRGMNDNKQKEKLKSITVSKGNITDVWIEEATELTQEDFDIIDDRLRGELPEDLFYQLQLTFNPVSATHWIKKVFFDTIDTDVLTHHSTYLDNRFIDEAYKRRMMRRKKLDPEGYRVYGLGEWGEPGGLILTNWKVKEISQNPNDYDSVSIGQDFGYNHANAILEMGMKDGDLYIYNELYLFENTTSDVIKEFKAKFGVSRTEMYCDSAEPDRILEWSRAGYRAKKVVKEKNSITNQIDWLKARNIYIHPSCVNLIKEIQQWKWKLDQQQNVYLDIPVDFFDDAIAAMRYGAEKWRKGTNTIKSKTKRPYGL